MFKKISFFIYLFFVFSLFLYSFTQVDLNLTLSRSSWYQTIEKAFQYIGYFNRPLSSLLFVVLLIILFGFWLFFFRMATKKVISRKTVWLLIIACVALLVFSYNAFSYDIFNYIFDARIFTFYHQNPYLHKALDFPQDKMLNFMHWTQRTYPYGPVWLGLTVPLSFIGLQYFLPTFFLFKFLMAGSFLGTCYFIEKISNKLFPKHTLGNLVFFGLNPLVLIESLVSAHLDIVMIFFAMTAVWFLFNKKWMWSAIFLVFSAGIKFATAFLLPLFVFISFTTTRFWKFQFNAQTNQKNQSFFWEIMFLIAAVIMILVIVLESYSSGNFQPWYIIIVLPFSSLLSSKFYSVIPSIIVSFCVLFEYLPYLYLGNWNPPVPTILFSITTGSVLVSIFATILYMLMLRFKILSSKSKK